MLFATNKLKKTCISIYSVKITLYKYMNQCTSKCKCTIIYYNRNKWFLVKICVNCWNNNKQCK